MSGQSAYFERDLNETEKHAHLKWLETIWEMMRLTRLILKMGPFFLLMRRFSRPALHFLRVRCFLVETWMQNVVLKIELHF